MCFCQNRRSYERFKNIGNKFEIDNVNKIIAQLNWQQSDNFYQDIFSEFKIYRQLDQEMDELADIIRVYEAENEEFENLFYLCCTEVDEIRDEIKVVKENQKYLQSIQKVTISSCDSSEKSYDNKCICSTLKEEIWKLRMEIILKNKKIQALEQQIHGRNALHKICKKRLQQLSRAHSYKISNLKMEIEQIRMAMLCIKAKECEVRKQRIINKRY
ncbi:hypothetical protein ALC53_04192 [Atta colombica]|uniref:Uncharacterized protein n=1 Tax=Atta colombica TaxID=520822 RepID=A0A195BL04_9HYME|nr:hypothetical protein ALC53_04192 [Atta colombica]